MLIHTYNLEVYGIGSENFDLLVAVESGLSGMASSCVSLFFAISGFLYFKNFRLNMLVTKYKSRFKSIVIPYIVWNTLYYLLFGLILKIPAIANFINDDQTPSVSIAGYIKYIYEGYYVFWFLRVLIWMFILTPVWYLLLKRRKYYWPEGVLVLLLLVALGKTPIPGYYVNAYYILGAYIGMNHCEMVNKENHMLSILATICFPIMVFLSRSYAGQFIFSCVLLVVIWLMLDLFPLNKDIKWWIKCTFFYYCAHDMILESIEKIILIIGGRSYLMAVIDYVVAPALTLLILIGGAAILRKWLQPIWRILSGGR